VNAVDEQSGGAERETAEVVVPEFYVALNLLDDGDGFGPGQRFAPRTEAVVRETATGNVRAAIAPPPPYGTFVGVTAAADHRMFVLAAQNLARLPVRAAPATRFFALRVDPAGRTEAERARLMPLPIPEQPLGRAVFDLALSADATRLAISAGPFTAAALHVFSMTSGAGRVWDGPRVGPAFGPGAMHGSLSWTADGRTLALLSSGAEPLESGVRLLDTTAPGDGLLASSRLVLPTPTGPVNPTGNYWRQVMISPDGQTIIAVLQVHAHDASGRVGHASQKLVTFSASTGTLLRTLNSIPVHGEYQKVLWASPSARRLIVNGTQPGPTAGPRSLGYNAGILSHERFTPIPWSNRTFAAAW
jgi:hypothetical protein